eukprot:TRINITY_DN77286_c0_g1_i1.p1 TRINITY_DN77286_c0_g1~~TRINITY_DN77286_c0_g1_i1.p1  ORF type:complete len:219 (-),score=53.51 TRINITY_DN77286_c0_g1_i1:91-747(-)
MGYGADVAEFAADHGITDFAEACELFNDPGGSYDDYLDDAVNPGLGFSDDELDDANDTGFDSDDDDLDNAPSRSRKRKRAAGSSKGGGAELAGKRAGPSGQSLSRQQAGARKAQSGAADHAQTRHEKRVAKDVLSDLAEHVGLYQQVKDSGKNPDEFLGVVKLLRKCGVDPFASSCATTSKVDAVYGNFRRCFKDISPAELVFADRVAQALETPKLGF